MITLAVIVVVPLLSMNPYDWSPSRLVQGHLPPPTVMPVSGDTWAFRISNFSLLHPVAFIEEVLSAKVIYVPALVAVAIPLLLTVIFGRVFCSFICPAGFIFELNQKTNGLMKKVGLQRDLYVRDLRLTFLVLLLILGVVLSVPVISLFDPPHVLGRELIYLFTHHSLSISGTGLLVAILLYETFFTKRTWCGSICPSGGALSEMGRLRILRISMDRDACTLCQKCNEVCPYFLEPMRLAEEGGFDWTKCDNCGLCRDHCPTGAIKYTLGYKGS